MRLGMNELEGVYVTFMDLFGRNYKSNLSRLDVQQVLELHGFEDRGFEQH